MTKRRTVRWRLAWLFEHMRPTAVSLPVVLALVFAVLAILTLVVLQIALRSLLVAYPALLKPIDDYFQIATGSLALLAVMLLAALVLWQRNITAFLAELRHRLLLVGMEDLEQRMPDSAWREFSQLSHTFNAMMESLTALMAQSSEKVQQVHTLARAVALLGEAARHEDLYEEAISAFLVLDKYSQVFLLVGEDELGPLQLMAARGVPLDVLARWRGVPWRPPLWGVVAPALASKSPHVVERCTEEGRPRPGEFPWEIAGESLAILPLMGLTGLQGVAILVKEIPFGFSSQVQFRLMEMTALYVARTMEGAHLVRNLEEHMTELVTLQAVTRAVVTARSVPQILEAISQDVADVAGPSDVALILASDMNSQHFHSALAPESPEYQALKEAIDWDVVRWVHSAGQPVFYMPGQVVDDIGDLLFESSGQAMVIPLEGRDETLGVLVVVSREEGPVHEESHLIGMRTVANAIVIAIYGLRQAGRAEEAA